MPPPIELLDDLRMSLGEEEFLCRLAELEDRCMGCLGEPPATFGESDGRRDSVVFRPGVFGAELVGLCANASVDVAMPSDTCRAGCDSLVVLAEMCFLFDGSSWPVSGAVIESMAGRCVDVQTIRDSWSARASRSFADAKPSFRFPRH